MTDDKKDLGYNEAAQDGSSEASPQASVPTITETVKALRLALGDTQQQFAHRLGLAISTVVRYESTRPPKGEALNELYQLARRTGLHHIAAMFESALMGEIRGDATTLLTSVSSSLAMLLIELREGSDSSRVKLKRMTGELEIILRQILNWNPQIGGLIPYALGLEQTEEKR
jgi:transcriptional regulator with XRE-family HTH domain